MKNGVRFYLILAALPLLIYPFILMANIMSLAGYGSNDTPFLLNLFSKGFLLSSSAYPVVYVFSVIMYFYAKRRDNIKRVSIFAKLPLIYLFFVYLFLMGWIHFDT